MSKTIPQILEETYGYKITDYTLSVSARHRPDLSVNVILGRTGSNRLLEVHGGVTPYCVNFDSASIPTLSVGPDSAFTGAAYAQYRLNPGQLTDLILQAVGRAND